MIVFILDSWLLGSIRFRTTFYVLYFVFAAVDCFYATLVSAECVNIVQGGAELRVIFLLYWDPCFKNGIQNLDEAIIYSK